MSTFGADQIDNGVGDASEATRRYFAVFYASINLGSVFSYLLVPAMRAIFGYAAAFAVPAVLLAGALAVFIGGRRKYTMLPPREGGVGVPAAIWRACIGGSREEAEVLSAPPERDERPRPAVASAMDSRQVRVARAAQPRRAHRGLAPLSPRVCVAAAPARRQGRAIKRHQR